MLIHHSGQDYNVAASEAATEARKKFDAEITRGQVRAQAVIEQVQNQVPIDRIVKGAALTFRPKTIEGEKGSVRHGIEVQLPGEDGPVEDFHKNAIGQAAFKADIPMTFVNRLQEKGEWGAELLAHNFNTIFKRGNGTKYLTRSVNGQIRGFLSDAYRRMDSRPIVEAFIAGVMKYGAVPVDGYAMDTKIAMKVVLPYIFEPVPNEVMIFGAYFETSDFGNGKLSLSAFCERLWCTNRAIASEDISKVHLGARLDENLQLSQKTYDLDTATMASAIADVSQKSLAADSVNQYMGLIKTAHEAGLDPVKAKDFLKKNLLKHEAEAVTEAFNSPDVVMLPPGNNVWRMTQAISWIAGTKIADEERQLEVMKVAGELLESVSK